MFSESIDVSEGFTTTRPSGAEGVTNSIEIVTLPLAGIVAEAGITTRPVVAERVTAFAPVHPLRLSWTARGALGKLLNETLPGDALIAHGAGVGVGVAVGVAVAVAVLVAVGVEVAVGGTGVGVAVAGAVVATRPPGLPPPDGPAGGFWGFVTGG